MKSYRRLGFASYRDYLRSELWRWVRGRVLARDDHRCLVCGAYADTVHHHSYRVPVMVGTELNLLSSICSHCHEIISVNVCGEKRCLWAANRAFDRRRELMQVNWWPVLHPSPI